MFYIIEELLYVPPNANFEGLSRERWIKIHTLYCVVSRETDLFALMITMRS